jgi:hypothetical protein
MARSFLSCLVAGLTITVLVVALAQPAAAAGSTGSGLSRAGSRAVSSGPTWGSAREVPGFGALNAGGGIDLGVFTSVSCASSGNCSGGGDYPTDNSGDSQPYVVSETNGTWGNATVVPGITALNTSGYAQLTSVSCASAGNCAAGGFYSNSSVGTAAFVVNEVNGTWGNAVEVPGTAALNTGGSAQLTSVSCASAGNCAAGGSYLDGSTPGIEAFVVNEVNGTWGNAVEVPGTAALNVGGDAQLNSVSCASAGNCTAGGYYSDNSGDQAFVISETNGTWGNAAEAPGTAALNTGDYAQLTSVSCASAGNCAAGGLYSIGTTNLETFLISETNGTWGNAVEAPGTAALNTGDYAQLTSVSCASAGNCAAGGFYTPNSSGNLEAFLISETNGTWGNAIEVPGTAALNASNFAQLNSVSCASAGNCAAGGFYADGSGNLEAFLINETSGTWGNAIEVPGTAALNMVGNAGISSVSCAPGGTCSAGGYYADSSGNSQAFVVDQAQTGLPAAPSNVKVVPSGPLAFSITWTSNSTNQAGFQVYNGVTIKTVGANQTSYVWPVSNPGTYMCFAVRAYNSIGYSAWAGMWTCATTPTSSPPAAPSNLKVAVDGPLAFYLTWKSNSTNQTGFQVYNGVTIKTVGANQTSYVWPVSNPGTYMCFAVRAYNSIGYSAWAGMWTCATTPAGGIPAAPANVIAKPYSTSAIEITFVNQANNETGFDVYNGVKTQVVNPPNMPVKGQGVAILWTGLAPGTYMCFKVAAFNTWGTSAYVPSSWTCTTTPTSVWPTDWASSSFCSNLPHWTAPYTGETFNGVAACGTADVGPNPNQQGTIFYNGVTLNTIGFQCEELAARYFYYVTGQAPPTPAEAPTGAGFAYDLNQYNHITVYPPGQANGTNSFQSSITPGNIISMWLSTNPAGPGHVGVVTNVSVNPTTKNGSITIMDENGGSNGGTDTITVTNGIMSYYNLYNRFQWTTNLPAPT